jgi:acyl carrier protein
MQEVGEIAQRVRAYIVESFLADDDAEQFHDHDDLTTLLDSLQLLRMVVALESSFSIKVQDSELTVENLGSVEKIAAFLARKCHEHQPSDAHGA